MTTPPPGSRPNPLDDIRREELAASQAIAAAREAATRAEKDARARAADLVREARAKGEKRAARRYEDEIAQARDRAEQIEANAEARIAALRSRAEPYLDEAVAAVVSFVLPEEGA